MFVLAFVRADRPRMGSSRSRAHKKAQDAATQAKDVQGLTDELKFLRLEKGQGCRSDLSWDLWASIAVLRFAWAEGRECLVDSGFRRRFPGVPRDMRRRVSPSPRQRRTASREAPPKPLPPRHATRKRFRYARDIRGQLGVDLNSGVFDPSMPESRTWVLVGRKDASAHSHLPAWVDVGDVGGADRPFTQRWPVRGAPAVLVAPLRAGEAQHRAPREGRQRGAEGPIDRRSRAAGVAIAPPDLR